MANKSAILPFLLRKIVYALIIISFITVSSCEKERNDDHEVWPQRITKIIAHRGYWRAEGSYENSLAAIENAAKIGADGVEFDVWTTLDDVLVVHHDKSFGDLVITETNYDELIKNRLPNGEKLPSLKEYLQKLKEYPQLIIFLEIEDIKAAQLVPSVVEQVRIKNKIHYISFMKYAGDMLLSANEGIHVELLVGESEPISPIKLKNEGYSGIDYSYTCFKSHPEIIYEAKQSEMTLSVWTVNSIEGYDWAFENGFDYITTDRPDLFVSHSSANSRYWRYH